MERRHFVKSLLVGSLSVLAVLMACSKTADTVTPASDTSSTGTGPAAATLVDVAQLYTFSAAAGSTVQFTNPYATELISFLPIWLLDPFGLSVTQLSAFNLASWPNQLVAVELELPRPPSGALACPLPFPVQMGRFDGRVETTCTVPEDALFFPFVLAGAFEVAGRLLHTGDGLALWDTSAVELEALSNTAALITLALAA